MRKNWWGGRKYIDLLDMTVVDMGEILAACIAVRDVGTKEARNPDRVWNRLVKLWERMGE